MLANVILRRLESYKCSTQEEYEAALLEIIQEIALLGLWRAKFFEKAAFYGGTALRILYKMDRFSEDLGFSLLTKNPDISMNAYQHAVLRELQSLGFEVQVEEVKKTNDSAIRSAFIKTNTRELFFRIDLGEKDQKKVHANKVLKVKFEVDTDPPLHFKTSHQPLAFPGPFSVTTFALPDLFAGKMHALLFRQYKGWVKGRDWYDYLWFLSQNVPVRLIHLQERMRQLGHWEQDRPLTEKDLRELLNQRIESLDVKAAQVDISRFLKDPWKVEQWSTAYFHESAKLLKISGDESEGRN